MNHPVLIPTLLCGLAVVLSVLSASPATADSDRSLSSCLAYETASERLGCLDTAVAILRPSEDTESGAVLRACAEEGSEVARLDCFEKAIGGREAARSEPTEGRPGVDFRLPRSVGSQDVATDCVEVEIQERHALTRRKQGEIAAGTGIALAVAGAVLGGIAAALSGNTTEAEIPTALAITGAAIGATGTASVVGGGSQLQMSWVHAQLASMESRRCGGALSIDRR